ncbi:hypothetical protein ACJW31_10G120800 [Castanea mollissima]
MEVFTRSFREEEDDEEALKWAALERLPTYSRMRKGMLTSAEGQAREIDIKSLGILERKALLDRLVKIAEEDNEKFLLKLKDRIDRVGLELPTVEVRFEHLNVEAEVYIGSRALPTIFNFLVNMLEGFLNYLHILPSRKTTLPILRDVSGIIQPQRMTLLLGPPSSGKTTLLLALAGKLGKDLKFLGRVTYNGHGMEEFVPQRTSAYISQHDLHIGEMTVRETLTFAARCQGIGQRYEILAELLRREKAANIKPDPDIDIYMKAAALEGLETSIVTDYVIKILGLEVCADTIVGDEMLRGISGGQKKRLTTGEMLVGPARALFMDEISTGLDSSTTFQIVNSLKQSLRILNGTAVISLLQPPPETYELFDDIILLSDGQIVYQGPRENVLEFFEYMGFKCPERKGVADFLQEVTSRKDQEQYWANKDEPYRFFKQYFLILCINLMASGLFRLMAALGRDVIVANTVGSFALLVVQVLGGFIISRDNVPKWWLWGYWISPLMYGQNAIAVNEFLGKSWRHVAPNSSEQLGVLVLKSRGIFPQADWYWIGVGALIGYIFLFNFLFTLALQYLSPFGKPQTVLSKEALTERNANRAGEFIELSSRGKSFPEQRAEDQRSVSSRSLSTRVGGIDEAYQNGKRGMVLPFEPLSIAFDEIRYAVDMPQEMKTQGILEDRLELLKGISGAFRPGVLTALMGVSGAGKTTLMDVLAGRKTSGYIQGSITISGYPKKQETFARISGYCEQTDIHSPHVTVYESLLYSAWLRLAPEVDSLTRAMFIDEVIELVELTSLREALVGLPNVSGLSTEQRKRLTIAVELVANPSIIFMDEPTSGLDARAAAIVMRTVRNTVDTGRTVLCTIHQPSIDIFDTFDELLLLKVGGEQIYAGPLGGHSSHLIKYFEEINGVPKIRDGYNPATWMLEVTSIAQETALGVNFTDVYRNSELHRRNKALIRELSTPPLGSKDLFFPTRYSQSFFEQCIACLWKQQCSYWRNPSYNAVRLLFTTIIALLFGMIFWDLGSKRTKQQDLFNAMGSMYTAVVYIGVQNGMSVQPIVATERTIFYRERAAGMYSALPYAIGQVVIELPYIFLQTVIYGVIVYAMMAFEWTVSKFLWYLFFMYFTLLYFTLYGMMTVALTPNHHIGSIVSSAFYAIWNLFSGFIVPQTRIPIWWRWYYWACPVAWTLYGLFASQYGDVKDLLESGETVEDFLRNYFGFRNDFLGVVAAVIVGIPVLFGFIFALSIKAFNFQKK